VNRGLGTSGQRVRIGAPREITLVTLLSPAVAAAA
jgi:predicted MPP superfamily phosphohydrolase